MRFANLSKHTCLVRFVDGDGMLPEIDDEAMVLYGDILRLTDTIGGRSERGIRDASVLGGPEFEVLPRLARHPEGHTTSAPGRGSLPHLGSPDPADGPDGAGAVAGPSPPVPADIASGQVKRHARTRGGYRRGGHTLDG
jgi:hypothetical protein